MRVSERSEGCSICGEILQITLRSIFASFEDEDLNRYFPLECPRRHHGCTPVVIHDGCDGTERFLPDVARHSTSATDGAGDPCSEHSNADVVTPDAFKALQAETAAHARSERNE